MYIKRIIRKKKVFSYNFVHRHIFDENRKIQFLLWNVRMSDIKCHLSLHSRDDETDSKSYMIYLHRLFFYFYFIQISCKIQTYQCKSQAISRGSCGEKIS